MIDANGFDREFYLARYPDVAKAGVDPYQHYLQYGWKEGRNPNLVFDTRFYLRNNGDVAKAGMNPLEHYVKYGWKEGRDPSAAFDTSDYIAVNVDVAQAGMNPMLHYLQYGAAEKRPLAWDKGQEILEGFDRVYYLQANPDVARAGIDPYIHYIQFGEAEGRKPDAFFDKAFYLARNPDVARAGINPLEHFLTYGWKEGRDPSAVFSIAKFRSANPDLGDQNALVRYVADEELVRSAMRYLDSTGSGIITTRSDLGQYAFINLANITINGTSAKVSSAWAAIDGRTLSSYEYYYFDQSIGNITISGSGYLPEYLRLGAGNDSLTGTFNLTGKGVQLSAGTGTLEINAAINNGSLWIDAKQSVSTIALTGNLSVLFFGGAAADSVRLGSGDDQLTGGAGTNLLDGGAGFDQVFWDSPVRVDLAAGRATPLGNQVEFFDTLVSIEQIVGSSGSDILLGDDNPNSLNGAFSSSTLPVGADFIAGRGGNDTLYGSDGNDTIIGGSGADDIAGGAGDDLLIDRETGWGPNRTQPVMGGSAGNDRIVYLLGAVGDQAYGTYVWGGTGADTYIIAPEGGTWGNLGVRFSQSDGDKLDFSALRTTSGAAVTLDYVKSASTTPFSFSTWINLGLFKNAQGQALSGHIEIYDMISPNNFTANDFIFTATSDWHTSVPSEFLPLI